MSHAAGAGTYVERAALNIAPDPGDFSNRFEGHEERLQCHASRIRAYLAAHPGEDGAESAGVADAT